MSDIERVDARPRGVFGEDNSERQIVVGSPTSPVWYGPISEARSLFTDQFWAYYDCWRTFNAGLGLPWANPNDADRDFVAAIRVMEEYYRAHFSPDRQTFLYLEAIIKRMDARR